MGCFKDTVLRAIDGGVADRLNTGDSIVGCKNLAEERGWTVFAVQHSTQCFTAANAAQTYNKYGESTSCTDGRGGSWASDVYEITCERGYNFSVTLGRIDRGYLMFAPLKLLCKRTS